MTDIRVMIARGLPLAERRAVAWGGLSQGQAENRLTRWRSQPPFEQDSWWQARLSAADLTEPRLMSLLGEPDLESAGLNPGLWWLDWADQAVAGDRSQSAPDEPAGEIYFGALVMPVVAQAKARLLIRLRGIQGSAQVLDPARMACSLAGGLAVTLDRMALRTLVTELKRARLAGQLRADDAAARFAEFAAALALTPRRRELFGRYPVLGRQLAVEAANWVESCTRMAGHLVADTGRVSAEFGGGAVGMVEEVVPGLGDRHSGGTVTLVRWTGGLELVYKPRSLALDVHFGRLASWLSLKGLPYPLRTAACVDLADHGWMEVVRPRTCVGQAQRKRFYRRQGCLLALLYLLGATDMHAENLIAAGEHPVVVDLETLIQPELPGPARAFTPADTAAGEAASSSVLNVGLLPQRFPGSRAGGSSDVSGLGWVPGQRAPLPVAAVRDPRTDQMRVELTTPLLRLPAHRPVAGDTPLRLLDYAADILAGFTQAYQLCQDNKAELAGGPLAAFSGDQARVVLRHTAWYAAILSMSFHPDVLRDGLDREQFLDVLWREAPRSPALAACAEHERTDLWRNDIPLFTTATDSTVLLDSQQQPVAGLTLAPGMDRLRDRLARLGPGDLARQRWLITTALGITEPAQDTAGPRVTVASPPAPSESAVPSRPAAAAASGPVRDCLLTAADAIGRRLHQTAFREAGSAQWLGISSPAGANWSVGPLRADLYHGLSGIALFLGYLGEVTGDDTHSELAQHALRTALARLEDDAAPWDGGLAGGGGIVYALCELARLWDQEAILHVAERHACRAASASDDTVFDFTGGSAGTIAGLLALHQLRPAAWLASQIQTCADRLVAAATRFDTGIGWLPAQTGDSHGAVAPPAGYAHGNSGIIPALLMAADLLGDDRYRRVTDEALAYEQAFYDADSGTWDDSRCYPGLPAALAQAAPRTSWCRGAAGIGISRLSCLTLDLDHDQDQYLDRGACRRDIDAALAAAGQASQRSHCLCHGEAGTLELYLHAASRDPGWRHVADEHAATILARIDRHGWQCGTQLNAQTPGLMVGLAGIGYGLLRAADPGRVPSALTLQPPSQAAGGDPAISR